MSEWMKNIRKVVPYTAGEQPNRPNMIKLNTNECPYAPAPGVEKVIREMDVEKFRLYPNMEGRPLIDKIAEYYGVEKDMVFAGVGSDDVIANAFMTFFNSDKPIFFPEITYSFYPVWADLYGVKYQTKELDKDYHLVKEDYYGENGGIIFPNPNAPTSVYESLDTIRDILEHNKDVIVIVDEAYIDFGGESALLLLKEYDNLLVVQTFSKSRSMAGMRIGFAIGNKVLIKAMNDVKYSINSYTLNMTSIMAGCAAIEDREYFEKTCQKIIDTRENSKKELKKLGFEFPDSKANFIFATHKDYDITELYMFLRTKDIYVRHWDSPKIKDYLRITIGTDEQMKKLFEAIESFSETVI